MTTIATMIAMRVMGSGKATTATAMATGTARAAGRIDRRVHPRADRFATFVGRRAIARPTEVFQLFCWAHWRACEHVRRRCRWLRRDTSAALSLRIGATFYD